MRGIARVTTVQAAAAAAAMAMVVRETPVLQDGDWGAPQRPERRRDASS